MDALVERKDLKSGNRKVDDEGAADAGTPVGRADARRDVGERRMPEARAPTLAGRFKFPDVNLSRVSGKKLAGGFVAAAALVAALWYGDYYLTVGRFLVSTDDAYVGASMSLVAPKVASYVKEVAIVDNQRVKAGDVLVRLDDGDFKLAVDQAAAKVETQKATVATFDAQIQSAQATAAQVRAQLVAAKATVVRADADFARADALAKQNFTPKATLDAARAARDSARAQVVSQEAAIQTADANIAVLTAQKVQAERLTQEFEVALEKARRDLSFTVITAPFDGVIGNKSVQVGDYVVPGKRLAAVVPLDKVYVDANLKETQLARVLPGQRVRVRVDALGSEVIEGVVESIAPASGSQFSLLPPENATGNFTKIVQRVPVRVVIPGKNLQGRLRPGLSVSVDIDTRNRPAKSTTASAPESREAKTGN